MHRHMYGLSVFSHGYKRLIGGIVPVVASALVFAPLVHFISLLFFRPVMKFGRKITVRCLISPTVNSSKPVRGVGESL